MQETVAAAVAPMRSAIPGEFIRINFDMPDDITAPRGGNLASLLEPEPFLIGVGEIAVEDTADHLIVRPVDLREVDICHRKAPLSRARLHLLAEFGERLRGIDIDKDRVVIHLDLGDQVGMLLDQFASALIAGQRHHLGDELA